VGKVIMKERLILRGDLARIGMGKYVILYENITIKPPYKKSKQ
jgi:hypothetical protein